MGVVMILVGVLMPTLGAAKKRAAQTRTAAAARSNAMAVMAYADDHDDIYPVAAPFVGNAMLDWEKPVLTGGYIEQYNQIDPQGQREIGENAFTLSGALVHPAAMMEPGATSPFDLAQSVAVRQHNVRHPSQKGMMVRWGQRENGNDIFWTWNPHDRPVEPVAFCDASVAEARCTDFRLAHDFFENWVGHPVLSTWSGARGLDLIEKP